MKPPSQPGRRREGGSQKGGKREKAKNRSPVFQGRLQYRLVKRSEGARKERPFFLLLFRSFFFHPFLAICLLPLPPLPSLSFCPFFSFFPPFLHLTPSLLLRCLPSLCASQTPFPFPFQRSTRQDRTGKERGRKDNQSNIAERETEQEIKEIEKEEETVEEGKKNSAFCASHQKTEKGKGKLFLLAHLIFFLLRRRCCFADVKEGNKQPFHPPTISRTHLVFSFIPAYYTASKGTLFPLPSAYGTGKRKISLLFLPMFSRANHRSAKEQRELFFVSPPTFSAERSYDSLED